MQFLTEFVYSKIFFLYSSDHLESQSAEYQSDIPYKYDILHLCCKCDLSLDFFIPPKGLNETFLIDLLEGTANFTY